MDRWRRRQLAVCERFIRSCDYVGIRGHSSLIGLLRSLDFDGIFYLIAAPSCAQTSGRFQASWRRTLLIRFTNASSTLPIGIRHFPDQSFRHWIPVKDGRCMDAPQSTVLNCWWVTSFSALDIFWCITNLIRILHEFCSVSAVDCSVRCCNLSMTRLFCFPRLITYPVLSHC